MLAVGEFAFGPDILVAFGEFSCGQLIIVEDPTEYYYHRSLRFAVYALEPLEQPRRGPGPVRPRRILPQRRPRGEEAQRAGDLL